MADPVSRASWYQFWALPGVVGQGLESGIPVEPGRRVRGNSGGGGPSEEAPHPGAAHGAESNCQQPQEMPKLLQVLQTCCAMGLLPSIHNSAVMQLCRWHKHPEQWFRSSSDVAVMGGGESRSKGDAQSSSSCFFCLG